ncbi:MULTISPECIES: transglutaminase-like cysteine peptidase [Pseudoalteromonas]|uniref:transglutaminase-like cysteine peptidase n=1 Tax=Pseudoalteromonas TaxID=53246 RepID=UPI0005FA47B0|nr:MULTISPECIES: transglutaminase-like cysteine peptidase [Pseudoalteromonas]MCF2861065.1 transglutaminase-like cysteine peptidase [Pseudoalteromonas sp. CNAT2-18]MCG7556934.1 transglutaminase-like cysteine peptidase [Pseudoalteromonas sp. CNAT2-18.1]MCG7569523.1 transglutaminase-like cysteine peptidase [Pseudoalteromonas sp. CNC9-20]
MTYGQLLQPQQLVEYVQNKGNISASRRAQHWLEMLVMQQHADAWRQLQSVNQFFNEVVAYQSDETLWHQSDYWATPAQLLIQGAGDCEDYAIAKFFTLVSLGIPDEQLRLMYVRHLTLDQPHMVVLYFDGQDDEPYVLDNFDNRIVKASEREDLKPIYSFNGQGLWLAKAQNLSGQATGSRVSAWEELIKQIEQESANKE